MNIELKIEKALSDCLSDASSANTREVRAQLYNAAANLARVLVEIKRVKGEKF